MAIRRWSGVLAAGLTALLATAGCGIIGGGGSAAEAGGPPEGGWPQAVDGRLTEDMCKLLTGADWNGYGHSQITDEVDPTLNSPNNVSCMYILGDGFSLEVQPTVESAKAAYAMDLANHRERIATEKTPSQLVENVVAGADASWFDAHSYLPDNFALGALRKGLLLTLNMSPRDQGEKAPQEILSGLAKSIFERVPDLGVNPSGPSKVMRLAAESKGAGKADISYVDPVTGEQVDKKGEKLPFAVEFTVPARPNLSGSITVTGMESGTLESLQATYSCAIGVDAAVAVQQGPAQFIAACLGTVDATK